MHVCVLVCIITVRVWSADHVFGIDTTLRARKVRDSNPGKGKNFSFSPKRPDQRWGPPSLLLNG